MIELLGKGGFGEVYKVRTHDVKILAMKGVKIAGGRDSKKVQREQIQLVKVLI